MRYLYQLTFHARAYFFIPLLLFGYGSTFSQYTVTETYTTNQIPTSFDNFDPTCSGSHVLDITLPPGASVWVSGIDIWYDMTSVVPYWKSNQRSHLRCVTTDSTEIDVFSGVGNFSGDEEYSRTGVGIADGIYTGLTTLSFEMRAWRTVEGGEPDPCNTETVRVKNFSWTITVHYDIDYDGDGYYSILDGDCDDFNPNVYPDANEICDLIDNDCDGDIDEGTSISTKTWNGSVDNNWNEPANWSPSGVPDFCTDVTIYNGYTVEINDWALARTIEIIGTSTLTNNANLEIGHDASIDYAMDIHGTFDNSLGNLFVIGTNNGLWCRSGSNTNCGNMTFTGMNTTAIFNEGDFTSSDFDYLEVNGSRAVSNFGTMSLSNIFLSNNPSQSVVVNNTTITINECGNGEANGLLANNGSFTNRGIITWNANAGSHNTNSFTNEGVVLNNDGSILPLINTNTGWGLEEINALLCFEDILSPVFAGSGDNLDVVLGQVLLDDYFTVAGSFDAASNSISFTSNAIGEDLFILQIEDTDGFCSYYIELHLTNPILGPNTYYRDQDEDGYGDLFTTTEACSPPAGYVVNDTDCDDTDDTIYPNAPELCDGVDNDCDFEIDEDAPVSTNFFLATTDNLWSNPANWSLGEVPLPCHDVVIPNTELCIGDVFFDANSIDVLGTLELNAGGAILGSSTFAIRNSGVINFDAGWYFFNEIAGFTVHNLGFMTVADAVYIDAANAFNMEDYIFYLDGSSTLINEGDILLPSVDLPSMSNGNSGLGIYIGPDASLTNDVDGSIYTMQNSLRPLGLLENNGCLCAGYDCFLVCD